MTVDRLEVRLDPERRSKLQTVAESKGITISDLIRDLIDQAFEESQVAYRLSLAERIANARVEDVPDPEELSRQLASTHDIPDLY